MIKPFLALAALAVAPPVSAGPRPAEQTLLAAGDAWIAAENAADEPALRALLDEKFVATFDADAPLAKEAFVRVIMRLASDNTRKQVMSDRSARIVGDTGVETGLDTISGTSSGKPHSAAWRFTAVYTQQGNAWKAVALHLVATQAEK